MSETVVTYVGLFVERKVWRQRSHGPYRWHDRSTPGPPPLPFGTLAWIMDEEPAGTGIVLSIRKLWGKEPRRARYRRFKGIA